MKNPLAALVLVCSAPAAAAAPCPEYRFQHQSFSSSRAALLRDGWGEDEVLGSTSLWDGWDARLDHPPSPDKVFHLGCGHAGTCWAFFTKDVGHVSCHIALEVDLKNRVLFVVSQEQDYSLLRGEDGLQNGNY